MQVIKMEEPSHAEACSGGSEVWNVEEGPWHNSPGIRAGSDPHCVQADSGIMGSSRVALIFLGVIPQRK